MSPEANLQDPSAELELAQRRELALTGMEYVSDILGHDVSAQMLLDTRNNPEVSHSAQLTAKRAVRFIGSIAKQDSEIAKHLKTDDDMYAVAEAMVVYGADENRYIRLLSDSALTPEEATGIYAVREVISDHFDTSATLQEIIDVLTDIGIDPRSVRFDVEQAVVDMYEAGYIVRPYSHPDSNPRAERLNPMAHAVVHVLDDADREYRTVIAETLRGRFTDDPQ